MRLGILLLILLSTSLLPKAEAAQANGRVIIHLGKLKYNDLSIIRDNFLVPLAHQIGADLPLEEVPALCATGSERVSLSGSKQEVLIYCRSTTSDLLISLQDERTQVLLWIGHPGLHTVTDHQGVKTAVNSFLLASDDSVVPKSIFSAASPNLHHLALITCHGERVNSDYLNSLPAHVSLLQARSFKTSQATDGLGSFLHMFSWPQQILGLLEEIPAGSETVNTPAKTGEAELLIEYRDLLSKRYVYEVLIGDTLIGFLSPQNDSKGRQKNKAQARIPFDPALLSTGALRVRADAVERREYAPPGRFVIDDILIDRIALSSEGKNMEILSGPIHLGDEQERWDAQDQLSFLSNWRDFQKLQPELELVLPQVVLP